MPSRPRRPLVRPLRRPLLPLLAGVVLTPFLLTPPAHAAVVNGVTLNRFESGVLQGINAQRAARGLRPLAVAAGTTDVARRWSAHMAAQAGISHNPSINGALSAAGSGDWHFLAENVAYGPGNNPASMVAAYMSSPPHRANILDPRAHYVGVGAADAAVSGFTMAFNTLDFVDSYSSSYGRSREPADAMPFDGGLVTSTTSLASFEGSWDPRLRTLDAANGLRTWGVAYSGPKAGDDNARFAVVADSAWATGYVDLLMRLPVDLRNARALRVEVAASTGDDTSMPVEVLVGNRGSLVPLGTVWAAGTNRTLTLALPAAAKRFNDQIRFRVGASRLAGIGSLLTQRFASVRIYQVDAVV